MTEEVTDAMRAAGMEAVESGSVSMAEIEQIYLAMEAARTPVSNSPTTNGEARMTQNNRETLDAIAAMMSEFVDNWPQPKKISTALALIAKTIRVALEPPKHDYWRAGEGDCPRELLAGNGELHTLRCKICGLEDLRSNSVCRAALRATLDPTGEKA